MIHRRPRLPKKLSRQGSALRYDMEMGYENYMKMGHKVCSRLALVILFLSCLMFLNKSLLVHRWKDTHFAELPHFSLKMLELDREDLLLLAEPGFINSHLSPFSISAGILRWSRRWWETLEWDRGSRCLKESCKEKTM